MEWEDHVMQEDGQQAPLKLLFFVITSKCSSSSLLFACPLISALTFAFGHMKPVCRLSVWRVALHVLHVLLQTSNGCRCGVSLFWKGEQIACSGFYGGRSRILKPYVGEKDLYRMGNIVSLCLIRTAAAKSKSKTLCIHFSHMSLHPLCVSVGIVRGWRWVRETSGTSILPKPCFRTLLSRSRSRSWPSPLSCWIHLIGWPFFYGRSKAHAVAGILGGVSIIVIWHLGWAVQQATVSSWIICRWLKSRIGWSLLALCCSGEGVELGVGGVGHPRGWAGVIAARPWAWHCAGWNCTTGSSWGAAGGGTGWSAVWVLWAKLSLVVDHSRLGARLVVGGCSDVVVAVGRILWSKRRIITL